LVFTKQPSEAISLKPVRASAITCWQQPKQRQQPQEPKRPSSEPKRLPKRQEPEQPREPGQLVQQACCKQPEQQQQTGKPTGSTFSYLSSRSLNDDSITGNFEATQADAGVASQNKTWKSSSVSLA
jgi:hypothetical protein